MGKQVGSTGAHARARNAARTSNSVSGGPRMRKCISKMSLCVWGAWGAWALPCWLSRAGGKACTCVKPLLPLLPLHVKAPSITPDGIHARMHARAHTSSGSAMKSSGGSSCISFTCVRLVSVCVRACEGLSLSRACKRMGSGVCTCVCACTHPPHPPRAGCASPRGCAC